MDITKYINILCGNLDSPIFLIYNNYRPDNKK